MFEHPPSDSPTVLLDEDPAARAARIIALGLAAAGVVQDGPRLDPGAIAAAREALAEWVEQVGAPPFELRRAGRRIAAVAHRLDGEAMRIALDEPRTWAAARLVVDECARHDRDFGWDVPLRDVARAIVQAAVRTG